MIFVHFREVKGRIIAVCKTVTSQFKYLETIAELKESPCPIGETTLEDPKAEMAWDKSQNAFSF